MQNSDIILQYCNIAEILEDMSSEAQNQNRNQLNVKA